MEDVDGFGGTDWHCGRLCQSIRTTHSGCFATGVFGAVAAGSPLRAGACDAFAGWPGSVT